MKPQVIVTLVRKSCGAATLIFDMGRQTLLRHSFTTTVGRFPGLASWATSPSCSAANRIARPIYHQSTDAPLLNLTHVVAPHIVHRRNDANLLNYQDCYFPVCDIGAVAAPARLHDRHSAISLRNRKVRALIVIRLYLQQSMGS